ncbi:MAG: hypothetical protein QOE45_3022 [Frankiaceae bacterium]|jgi:5-hydroxyisourate hydrolase-like protein (transthyretin family)|nr:hypothetical protein [Frankiaceae bacterium]
MRVAVTPDRATVSPGTPVVLTVAVTNTGDVISGHQIRVLGVDPRWVELTEERLSLFPGATGASVLTLTLPPGLLAGTRRLSVQVRELTGEGGAEVVDVDLELPPVREVETRMEPASVTAGKRASFAMVVQNTGNVALSADLAGSDEEEKVRFRFAPERLELGPGEHDVVEMALKARRRFAGSLAVRPFKVRIYDPAAPAEEPYGVAQATFLQRPVLSRGALSLAGLLGAVTIFALVITYALSGVVGRSSADRDLALQVAQARNATAAGNASMGGTVRLLTAGTPVPGVTVELLGASDTANVLTSVATTANGAFNLTGVAAGSYKLRFRGAGFAELWYPSALTDADATTVEIQAGATKSNLDVRLGGLPATISGTVSGGDPTGATVTLLLPGTASANGGGGSSSSVTTTSATGQVPATVRTVKVGADGAFALTNVPSPSVYDLAVAKEGFATQVERVDIGGGEQRTGLDIRLLKGDGVISGIVSDSAGPVGGATVSAQYGGTTTQTATQTEGQVGAFTLRGLPTPQNLTVVVSADGHASQTLALSLVAGQKLTGVAVTLGGVSGSLSGSASMVGSSGVTPAMGASVVVTNGALTVQTVTTSLSPAGSWRVAGLPLPSTYTVTFSRGDLAPQTIALSLDSFGNVTGGGAASASTVNATLRSSTVDLQGRTFLQKLSQDPTPAAEVTITLATTTSTYKVTSTSVPTSDVGRWRIDHLSPGTYTLTATSLGSRPSSQILRLEQGVTPAPLSIVIAAPASISGTVRDGNNAVLAGAEVRLFVATSYPGQPAQTVFTDNAGVYTFTGVAAPQQYVVEFDYPPGSTPSGSATISLAESQQATVDLGGP